MNEVRKSCGPMPQRKTSWRLPFCFAYSVQTFTWQWHFILNWTETFSYLLFCTSFTHSVIRIKCPNLFWYFQYHYLENQYSFSSSTKNVVKCLYELFCFSESQYEILYVQASREWFRVGKTDLFLGIEQGGIPPCLFDYGTLDSTFPFPILFWTIGVSPVKLFWKSSTKVGNSISQQP